MFLSGCSNEKKIENAVNCDSNILFAEYVEKDKNFNIGFSLKLEESVCGIYTLQIPAIVENGFVYYYSVTNNYNGEIREKVFYKLYIYDKVDYKGQTSPELIVAIGEGKNENFQIFIRSQDSSYSEKIYIVEVNYTDLDNIGVRFIDK